jgi:hypothetical protein
VPTTVMTRRLPRLPSLRTPARAPRSPPELSETSFCRRSDAPPQRSISMFGPVCYIRRNERVASAGQRDLDHLLNERYSALSQRLRHEVNDSLIKSERPNMRNDEVHAELTLEELNSVSGGRYGHSRYGYGRRF